MKASELMIGDLVYYSHTEDGIAPYKEVICIQAEDLCRDSCIIETHFEPIPLTPEILEKNGFTRLNKRVRYFNRVRYFEKSTDYYYVAIYEITDSTWRFEYHNHEAHFPPCLMLIAYVHELQHALRLCRIEKEITI